MPLDKTTAHFLLLCLRASWDASALDAARGLASRGDVDWEAFLEQARAGSVTPLLYTILQKQGLLPADVEEHLQQAYYANAARNIHLLHTLEGVLRCLATEGIPVILLKGAALAEAIYENAATRPMCDLDLLVRQKDAPAALRALSELGYWPVKTELHAGDVLAYENEIVLRKPGEEGVSLEVHWSLFDSPHHQRLISLAWFWDTAQPMRVGDCPALALCPEAQVLHLCGHLVLHHDQASSSHWLWLHDIARAIAFYEGEKPPGLFRINWGLVLSQAQACDLVLPLQRILPRIAAEWQAPVPPAALDQLATLRPSPEEARVFSQLTAAHRPVGRRFWADLSSLPGWRQRLYFAWSNLFPSPAYMRQRYRIRRPILLPVYYPYRWVLGLRSLFSSPPYLEMIAARQPNSSQAIKKPFIESRAGPSSKAGSCNITSPSTTPTNTTA